MIEQLIKDNLEKYKEDIDKIKENKTIDKLYLLYNEDGIIIRS